MCLGHQNILVLASVRFPLWRIQNRVLKVLITEELKVEALLKKSLLFRQVKANIHIVVTILLIVISSLHVSFSCFAQVSQSQVVHFRCGVCLCQPEDVPVVGQNAGHPISGYSTTEGGSQDMGCAAVQGGAIIWVGLKQRFNII